MEELRVLIVADDPLARGGLVTVLEGQPGYTVAGQIGWDADLQHVVGVYQPEVVLWDLGWDSSLAADRLTSLRDIPIPVVLLLSSDALASEAWNAGARGMVLRDADTPQLLSALTAAVHGLVAVDPTLAAVVHPSRDETPANPAGELTRRELEVLRLLAEGLPNKAIADALSISEHTVKFHLNTLFSKLGVQSRTEAVTRATRLGLILL